MTDEQLIESWLHDRPANTRSAYKTDIAQFQAFLKGRSLARLTLEDMQAFSTQLQQRQLKDTTRRRKLNAVKSLYSFAVKQGYVPLSPAAAIRMPKTNPNLAGRILTPDAVKQLIEAAESDRDRLFLLLMYAVGARVSEICALTWRDFVRQANGKTQVTIVGKGGKARSVLVPESVWRQLQGLRGSNLFGGGRLFPFSRQSGHSLIKRAVENANLDPGISCHWLRHCHARHALDGGARIHVVRDTLGHSSIAVTNWYLESMPDESSSDYLAL